MRRLLYALDARSKVMLAFVGLVSLFSSLPYYLIIHTGYIEVGAGLGIGLLMWCPALAALATCGLFRIEVASLGLHGGPSRYVCWGYVIPLLYNLPVYATTWILLPGSFSFSFADRIGPSLGFAGSPRTAGFLLGVPLVALVGILMSLAYALGEEVGWRGFLLPRLVSRFGFTGGCLLCGCIWAVWHYPIWLYSDYHEGSKDAHALACFTLLVIAFSYMTGWLRLKSNSVWPAAMLHASQNLFTQSIFDQMTSAKARFVTGESGCGLMLAVAITAAYFWLRRKSLEPLTA